MRVIVALLLMLSLTACLGEYMHDGYHGTYAPDTEED